MGKNSFFAKFAGLVLLSLILVVPGAAAKPTEVLPPVITQLTPGAKHANLDQAIVRLLSRYHYRQGNLNDMMSSNILESYIEALDFYRSYFLASDIAAFNRKYRFTLDNHLLSGNLQPAYEIFNVYQQRLVERTARAVEQLQQDMDFTINESLELNRENMPWAASKRELDEIWRKRLKHELLLLIFAGQEEDEARDTLQKRYQGRLRRAAQSTSEDVFQTYMNAVSQIFDPHTAYFSPRASENFNIQMRLSLEGIGTVLRMEEEQVTVVELVTGGPADLSNQIKPGDRIIGVGQGGEGPITDIVGWRLDDVVDLIRGPRGSQVRLQIIPADAGVKTITKTVQLKRDTIKLEEQAAQSEIKTFSLDGHPVRIGIITIPTFYSDFAAAQRGEKNYRSTTRDVRLLLKDLKHRGVDGIVVDLRQNGGGSLQEAVELTGLFIKGGPIVQVRSSTGSIEVETDPDPALIYDGPLAVMVDRFSASASEIFAGAIQDYGRGIVIGDPTFGKGTVQTLIDLDRFIPESPGPMGQLKLTIAKFYRISGSSTQHRGVIPDISFPSAFDRDEVGESAQQYALPWDEIRAIYYQQSPYLEELIPEIRQRHKVRMASDASFQSLWEELEEAKQARESTRVSLLKSKREAEWEEAQTKQRERENQYRAAHGLKPLRQDEEISERDEAEEPDLLLEEGARILVDLIDLLDQRDNRRALVMTEK